MRDSCCNTTLGRTGLLYICPAPTGQHGLFCRASVEAKSLVCRMRRVCTRAPCQGVSTYSQMSISRVYHSLGLASSRTDSTSLPSPQAHLRCGHPPSTSRFSPSSVLVMSSRYDNIIFSLFFRALAWTPRRIRLVCAQLCLRFINFSKFPWNNPLAKEQHCCHQVSVVLMTLELFSP